jgi:hypothetical protein
MVVFIGDFRINLSEDEAQKEQNPHPLKAHAKEVRVLTLMCSGVGEPSSFVPLLRFES